MRDSKRRLARRFWTSWWSIAVPLAALAPGAAAARSITGVCPDGSVFIVQRAESIPCEHAKRVEPHEVPPIRPEYLPEPYTWQVYKKSIDPQNPYNAIDSARKVRELQGRTAGYAPPPEVGAPPPGGATLAPRAAPPGPESFALSDGEIRDLFLIVELSQERAPVAFVKETADGRERLRVTIAHSHAFQERFEGVFGSSAASYQVLLFSAVANAREPFFANFTFTQGHLAFQPDRNDGRQLGLLHGSLGKLSSGEAVLGYVVVPANVDLAAPTPVYWNDRRIEATLIPSS